MTTFISTAIPYVNAKPHVGFAYELVLADIIARHRRRRGRAVQLVSGTDDNSLKNVVAATREGVTTRALVDRNAAAFAALNPLLGIEPDEFVRTSCDPRHRATVEALWRACSDDLYRRAWTGRYCVGCEAFVDDDVAICDEHGVAPEPVSEENWFFRLSRYRIPIREAIESGRLRILPDAAHAETLAFLAGDVRDLSVSRDATRSSGWGIGVPGDPSQVIYVWFDALAYYLTPGTWRDLARRTHVIGKGIVRFHAVYWPAFLLAAGLPLPDEIFVHGYLTVDGKKIGKSRHDLAPPPDTATLVAAHGRDALRWYFARRCRTRSDADVSVPALRDAHDRDLSDRLGNLVQRCTTLAAKLTNGRVPPRTDDLRALGEALPARVDTALDAFVPDEACAAIIELLDAANRALDRDAPWRTGDPAALYAPLEAARLAAAELSPIVPGVARVVLERLGDADDGAQWGLLEPGAVLRLGAPPVPRGRSSEAP